MTPEEIKAKIENALPGASATVSSPDNIHFKAHVIYSGFNGQNRIKQHRMVYQTLGDSMTSAIHALELSTST